MLASIGKKENVGVANNYDQLELTTVQSDLVGISCAESEKSDGTLKLKTKCRCSILRYLTNR